jgi:adenylate kinase
MREYLLLEHDRIQCGMLILVTGDPEEIAQRLRLGKPKIVRRRNLGKAVAERHQELKKMQADFIRLYDDAKGLKTVDSKFRSADEVVKEISRIVFLGEYHPVDLLDLLRRVEANGRM